MLRIHHEGRGLIELRGRLKGLDHIQGHLRHGVRGLPTAVRGVRRLHSLRRRAHRTSTKLGQLLHSPLGQDVGLAIEHEHLHVLLVLDSDVAWRGHHLLSLRRCPQSPTSRKTAMHLHRRLRLHISPLCRPRHAAAGVLHLHHEGRGLNELRGRLEDLGHVRGHLRHGVRGLPAAVRGVRRLLSLRRRPLEDQDVRPLVKHLVAHEHLLDQKPGACRLLSLRRHAPSPNSQPAPAGVFTVGPPADFWWSRCPGPPATCGALCEQDHAIVHHGLWDVVALASVAVAAAAGVPGTGPTAEAASRAVPTPARLRAGLPRLQGQLQGSDRGQQRGGCRSCCSCKSGCGRTV